jgi:hypothetical protein
MQASYAQTYYIPASYIMGCAPGVPNWMVSTRIVTCVENGVTVAMHNFLIMLTFFYQDTITVIIVFSVLLLGIKVTAGIEDLNKESMVYLMKLGLVLWFSFLLGNLHDAPAAIMRWGVSLVVGGWSPWEQLDVAMDRMFGLGGSNQLFNGLMGLVFGALFSGISGILVFIMAMLALITTIYFVFRAIFSYLSAFILLSFLLVLTPLMVPLALFANTSRYTDKWIDYIIATIIHPIILFAFMYMFVGTINYMLEWFIGNMGGNDFSSYWRSRNAFSWVMTADPQTTRMLENTLGAQPGRTALQNFMSPAMSQAVDANPINGFALDFGVNQVWALQLMVFGFLGIFIVSYLMLSMINYLPEVTDSITGIATGLKVEGIPFVSEIKQGLMKLKGAMSGR